MLLGKPPPVVLSEHAQEGQRRRLDADDHTTASQRAGRDLATDHTHADDDHAGTKHHSGRQRQGIGQRAQAEHAVEISAVHGQPTRTPAGTENDLVGAQPAPTLDLHRIAGGIEARNPGPEHQVDVMVGVETLVMQ